MKVVLARHTSREVPSNVPTCLPLRRIRCTEPTPAEYAGIHARTEEEWPDQYAYHYPKIFDGHAGPCSVSCDALTGRDDSTV